MFYIELSDLCHRYVCTFIYVCMYVCWYVLIAVIIIVCIILFEFILISALPWQFYINPFVDWVT